MFKSWDNTMYWAVGDKVIVDYFGNDPSRSGSQVEAEIIAVDDDTFIKSGEVCNCRLQITDSVDDGEGEYNITCRMWGSQLKEVPR